MNRRAALRNAGLLAGASITVPTLLTLLQSCQTEPRLDWTPKFLSEDEAVFISAFVDAMLPRTDTPGALDVKADMFIDKVWAQTTDEAGKEAIRANIASFNASCQNKQGKPFAALSDAQRKEVFLDEEKSSPTYNGGVWGTAVGKQEPVGFYRSLKSMTLWAYTSTEVIATEILTYDPIPGEYNGCLPLEDVGNRYSL